MTLLAVVVLTLPVNRRTTSRRVGGPLVFSADNRTVAYWARTGDEWFTIAGARTVGPLAWVSEPRWNADGSKVAFGAFEGAHHEWKVIELK